MLTIMRRELTLLTHERLAVLVILLGAATAYSLLIGNLYRGGNFSEKFYRSESVNVAFLQDGSNTLQASYESSPMQSIGAAFSAKFNQRAAMANSTLEISSAPVTLNLRLPANPTQSYMAFYMYGVMLMAAQVGMIMGFSLSIHGDFRAVFFRQQTLIPLVAKAILYLALSLMSVALGVFFLATFGNLTFRSGFGDMILICAAFLFAVEGLAGLEGIYFKTKLALVQTMVFYTLPAFLLLGYI